jgi:hypothetical protein
MKFSGWQWLVILGTIMAVTACSSHKVLVRVDGAWQRCVEQQNDVYGECEKL